jgi:hypothetical protein
VARLVGRFGEGMPVHPQKVVRERLQWPESGASLSGSVLCITRTFSNSVYYVSESRMGAG